MQLNEVGMNLSFSFEKLINKELTDCVEAHSKKCNQKIEDLVLRDVLAVCVVNPEVFERNNVPIGF
jgi:hypothetical protein